MPFSKTILIGVGIVGVLLMPILGSSAEPLAEPQLQIETGMHTTPITQISKVIQSDTLETTAGQRIVH